MTILEPTRSGYAFDGWTVGETVTEDGTLFMKGAPFDTGTRITTDLKLSANWKHVHSYYGFRIKLFNEMGALTQFEKYDSKVHVGICGCGDMDLVEHDFDSNGLCACGFQKPAQPKVKLEVLYGQWTNGAFQERMRELPKEVDKNQQISKFAPDTWGSSLNFVTAQ